MMQHLVHDFFSLQLEWVISRPVVHFFQQRFLRRVAHKDMEMCRFARADNMIAELHEFRRQAAGILAFEQITHALLTRDIRQDLMPGVLILTGAGLVAAMKLHDAVFNADGIHIGSIPFR